LRPGPFGGLVAMSLPVECCEPVGVSRRTLLRNATHELGSTGRCWRSMELGSRSAEFA
jgi:hypothetical protein